jgi:hypothetical protein
MRDTPHTPHNNILQDQPTRQPCRQGAPRSGSDQHLQFASTCTYTPYVEQSTGVPGIRSRAHRVCETTVDCSSTTTTAQGGVTTHAHPAIGWLSPAVSSPCIGSLARKDPTVVGTWRSSRVLKGKAAVLCWQSSGPFVRVHVSAYRVTSPTYQNALHSTEPHRKHSSYHAGVQLCLLTHSPQRGRTPNWC